MRDASHVFSKWIAYTIETTSDTPHYENVPFDIPSSWVWTTLGEISNYGDNKNVLVENIGFTDWVLELEDIEKDSGIIVQCVTKSERKINGTRHKFSTGEILYSKLRTYLNKVLIAPSDGYCTTEIMPFGTFGILSNDYVCHVLRSTFFLDYTIQCGYGVKMPRLSTTDACNGMIPLPPFSEQERIVCEIKRWFALIDLIEQGKVDLQATIKQAKSKILDLAIHGKLVPQDPNDEPASELLKRINPAAEITCDNGHYQNILFELPYNWSWATLCEITEFIRNGAQIKQVKGAVGIPITRIETISNCELDLTRMGYSDIFNENEYSNYYLQEGDILMSHINSRIHVGKCALCRNIPYKIIHGMNLLRICLKKEILPEYITLFFRTNIFYTQIEPYIKNAVNQASINITNLQKTLMPIPPFSEQKRIVDAVNKTFAKLDIIMENL